jgi:hypothetical protein
MRVTEWFNLPFDQAEIDFVDIDVTNDKRLFVDPHALRLARTVWSARAARLVSTFFSHLLELIHKGNHEEAHALLCHLMEPNETHLGYSVAKSRGHALGPDSALLVLDALTRSRAVQSGIVRDLEDTILLIAGIDKDIVSDMTTNIIRALLIDYTQQVCATYDVPTAPAVAGAIWDADAMAWRNGDSVTVPHGPDGPLLFVPKIAVRVTPELDRAEYHRAFITPALQQEEIAAGSELVRLAKSGEPTVLKGDINRKYGTGKGTTADVTQRRPELLDAFRRGRGERMRRVPTQEQFAKSVGAPKPDWNAMASRISALSQNGNMTAYARRVFGFMTAILHPSITSPGELWYDNSFAGLTFAAVNAADGPLSAVFDQALTSAVQIVAANVEVDLMGAEAIAHVLSSRRQPQQLSVVVARSFSAEARAVLERLAADNALTLLDHDALDAIATARRDGNQDAIALMFAVAA